MVSGVIASPNSSHPENTAPGNSSAVNTATSPPGNVREARPKQAQGNTTATTAISKPPGTHITVNMHVNRNEANEKQEGDLRISANNFYLDLEDMKDWDDSDLIARADAQAWNAATDELLPIERVQTDLKNELGEYSVTFHTVDGLSITRKIWVIDQKVVENKKVNEAVSAFNFFKTPDEIQESIALDTDLKTWANAQAWKLDDENESVGLSVEYDFDPENIREGIYPVTFWTTGREFKIHTTDFVKEGKKVGLTFEPEDIHVMEKMGFSE